MVLPEGFSPYRPGHDARYPAEVVAPSLRKRQEDLLAEAPQGSNSSTGFALLVEDIYTYNPDAWPSRNSCRQAIKRVLSGGGVSEAVADRLLVACGRTLVEIVGFPVYEAMLGGLAAEAETVSLDTCGGEGPVESASKAHLRLVRGGAA